MHRIIYVRIHMPFWLMMTQDLVPLSIQPPLTSQESVLQNIAVTPERLRYHFILSIDKQGLFTWQLLWLNALM